ncbi:amino acid ABC transporter permease [Nocardioides plantarum]|uniref:Amino acid ABC transporter permease n=1 Tax=Nocardioides plantarum TaxID=29299 RepID=A0ABV5K979_9ACTN|nr:amino acid ABC transporter permease [Nocardioides plantarum]
MDVIADNFPAIRDSFLLCLQLAFFSGVLSLALGTGLAVFRVSPVPVLRLIGATYVNVVRNTPLTLVMLFVLFGLAYQLGLTLDDELLYRNNFWLAVLALTLYTSTFVCEVLRSGINTVHVGQAEAARAIGLTFTQNLRHVILPQAIRAVIAPMGSVIIALTKNTTVAVVIGVTTAEMVNEPAGLMRALINANGDVVPLLFLTFALGFVIITLPMGLATTWAASRLRVRR